MKLVKKLQFFIRVYERVKYSEIRRTNFHETLKDICFEIFEEGQSLTMDQAKKKKN